MPIQQREGVGRPRTYCGPACRQLAAFEIRRLQQRLTVLETQLSDLRHAPDFDFRDYHGRRKDQQLVAIETEIVTAETRLRLLLEGGDQKGP
ncbi:MAG: hypothetical protein ABSB57_03240 [Dehalococcoidia bacterium]